MQYQMTYMFGERKVDWFDEYSVIDVFKTTFG